MRSVDASDLNVFVVDDDAGVHARLCGDT